MPIPTNFGKFLHLACVKSRQNRFKSRGGLWRIPTKNWPAGEIFGNTPSGEPGARNAVIAADCQTNLAHKPVSIPTKLVQIRKINPEKLAISRNRHLTG